MSELVESRLALEEKSRVKAVQRLQNDFNDHVDEEARLRGQLKRELMAATGQLADRVKTLEDKVGSKALDELEARLAAHTDKREQELSLVGARARNDVFVDQGSLFMPQAS